MVGVSHYLNYFSNWDNRKRANLHSKTTQLSNKLRKMVREAQDNMEPSAQNNALKIIHEVIKLISKNTHGLGEYSKVKELLKELRRMKDSLGIREEELEYKPKGEDYHGKQEDVYMEEEAYEEVSIKEEEMEEKRDLLRRNIEPLQSRMISLGIDVQSKPASYLKGKEESLLMGGGKFDLLGREPKKTKTQKTLPQVENDFKMNERDVGSLKEGLFPLQSIRRTSKRNEEQSIEDIKWKMNQQRLHKSMSKNKMGYAVLDGEGRFFWADKEACSLLEEKYLSLMGKNIFDMMHSLSKHELFLRFNSNFIFSEENIGNGVSVSFLKYSNSSTKRFAKVNSELQQCFDQTSMGGHQLPENSFKSQMPQKNCSYARKEIFFKHLRALSAQFFVIGTSFAKEEKVENYVQKVNDENELAGVSFERNWFGIKEEIKKCSNTGTGVVLMKIRLSKSIPPYDYRILENDPVIVTQEALLKKRISLILVRGREEERKRRNLADFYSGEKI